MAKGPTPKRGRSSPLFSKPAGREYEPPGRELEPAPNFDLLDDETKEKLRLKAAAKVEATERDRGEDKPPYWTVGMTTQHGEFPRMTFLDFTLHFQERDDLVAFFDACSIAHRAWLDTEEGVTS